MCSVCLCEFSCRDLHVLSCSCIICVVHRVVYFVCWFLFPVSFVSIEFRKRVGCEDPFDYVGSSASWRHSSSKRDLRQDDHFPRYHYYHCHASFTASIDYVSFLSHVKYQPLNNAMITSNLFDLANHWLAMLLLKRIEMDLEGGWIGTITNFNCYLAILGNNEV